MTVVPVHLRRLVVQRAFDRCEYCHLPQSLQVATFPVDHVIPRSRGGGTDLSNLALACPRCNAVKWTFTEAIDPVSSKVVELFHPRQQIWDEHFRWSAANPAILEALTPVGRSTLALLELNSAERIAIRQWLIAIGMHPPD